MSGLSYREELRDNARTLSKASKMAFGEFLSLPPWEWYVTLTFRDDMKSPKLADKAYYSWFNTLRVATKVKYDKPSIYGPEAPFYFRVTELQERDVLHFHSLIGGVGDVRRLLFKDFWELNGFARVMKYEAGRGANYYVGKYLNKDGGDIRFSHNLKPYLKT